MTERAGVLERSGRLDEAARLVGWPAGGVYAARPPGRRGLVGRRTARAPHTCIPTRQRVATSPTAARHPPGSRARQRRRHATNPVGGDDPGDPARRADQTVSARTGDSTRGRATFSALVERMRAAARHGHCELARRTACGRGPRRRQPTTSTRVCPGSSHAGCRARSSVRHPAGYASRVRARDQFPIGPGGPALQGPLELVGRVRSLHRPGRRPASRGMSTRTNTVNNHQEEDRP